MKRHILLISGVGGLLITAAPVAADSFVLDPASPTLSAISATSADILNDPASLPGFPVIGIPYSALGLQPDDWIDALSDGEDEALGEVPDPDTGFAGHSHLFAVTRPSAGQVGTGVRLERMGDTVPGTNPGHPADLFFWEAGVAGNVLAPAGFGWTAGTTDGDEANAGLRNRIGDIPGDEVCAYDVTTMTSDQTPSFEVYFSLAAGSPTVGTTDPYGNVIRPGDILAVGGAFGPSPVVFRPYNRLGLPMTADLDALSLEVGAGPAGPYLVRAEYSVTSATAGFTLPSGIPVNSGADVIRLEPTGMPVHTVVHTPPVLGLRGDDDLDALESVAEEEGDPCDLNEDGVAGGLADLATLLAAYGCSAGDTCYNPRADVDESGSVELSDLAWFLANCY
jgi:hypothetical protein